MNAYLPSYFGHVHGLLIVERRCPDFYAKVSAGTKDLVSTLDVQEPQSTLRSLPQTSSAFFLPLVSGTYHQRKPKKNADSAAKIR